MNEFGDEEHLPPPLRYRSRIFIRHLLIAAVSAVLPLALILLGLGIELLNDVRYSHPGLASFGAGFATMGACAVPLALAALLALLSMVAELQELERRERWVLRFAILFMLLGLAISSVLAFALLG